MSPSQASTHTKVRCPNGYCGTSQPGHLTSSYSAILNPSKNIIEIINDGIELFTACLQNGNNDIDIRYAWEETTKVMLDNKIRLMDIENADTLIVIGYSFPKCNKDIDKKILQNMQSLKSIYLQYPDGTHDSINEKLKILDVKCNVFNISNLDSFYIPY